MKNLQNLFDTACPQELNALLKSLPEPTLPPDVAGRISANACRKADIQPIRTVKKRKIVYVISATARVLVLLAGILTLMILQTPPPQPTEPISTEPIFTDPTESAATPKSPTQAPSPSQSTPEKELPPANTLEDLWAQYTEESFIWGEETEGGSFGGEGLGDSSEDNSNKEWNGLTVSAALYRELTNNLPQTLYAIGADSLLPITLPYEDFVYEGKTTAEFNAEYKKIYHTWEQVVRLKRIVFLAEQDGADQYHELDWLAESAEQIFRTTDPEILEKYSNGKDLNKELIRADSDVNYAELEKIKQKRNERTAAWRDQYYVYPNFAEFINAGYYVVQNDRYFFLITDAQGLSKLADVIKEQNLDPTLLTKTVYRKANGKELGLPAFGNEAVPDDDEATTDDILID